MTHTLDCNDSMGACICPSTLALSALRRVVDGLAPELRETCQLVLEDPRFQQCWGGTQHHHMYDGGLVVHTNELMQYAIAVDAVEKFALDWGVLATAIIFHDYAKIYDYQRLTDGTMVPAPYKKLIHHVQGSAIEFAKAAQGMVAQDVQDKVIHCILSHHGRREWGSQIEPQTREACILHSADTWSMMFGEGR